jgi:hypothetical protein
LTAAVVLASVSCASGGVRVRTTAAPDADVSTLHTYRVLDAPRRRADAPALPPGDPMLNNSITNRRLRADLVQQLTQKGYAADATAPDFLVAYYAGTMEKMDTTYWAPDPWWSYGYRRFGRFGPRFISAWPRYGYASPYPAMDVRTYTRGAVIVDVIDAKTMELLWRGQGEADVSDDPAKYGKDLDASVAAIMKRFPQSGGLRS